MNSTNGRLMGTVALIVVGVMLSVLLYLDGPQALVGTVQAKEPDAAELDSGAVRQASVEIAPPASRPGYASVGSNTRTSERQRASQTRSAESWTLSRPCTQKASPAAGTPAPAAQPDGDEPCKWGRTANEKPPVSASSPSS